MSGSANFHAKISPSGLDRTTACHASVHLTQEYYTDVVVNALRQYKYLIPYLVNEVPDKEWSKAERKVVPLVQKIFKAATGLEGTPKEKTVWHDEVSKLTPAQQKMIEQNAGSVAAREGTRAHDFAEAILLGDMDPADLPEEFFDGVMMYVQHCWDLDDLDPEDLRRVEMVVPIFYNKESTCTADFVKILGNRDRIFIRDLKYGKGKFVVAKENKQIATYARSVVETLAENDEFDLHDAVMVDVGIVQPRNNEGESHIRSWRLRYRDLVAFTDREIAKEVEEIERGSMKYGPSEDVCRWCPVKDFCKKSYFNIYDAIPGGAKKANEFFAALPDYKDHASSEAKYDAKPPLERGTIQGFDTMEIDDLVKLWKARKALARMADDLDDYLKFLVEGGLEHPELKLVMGRAPNPYISDEADFAEFLLAQGYSEEQVYKTSVIGITEARKLLGERIRDLKRNIASGVYDKKVAEGFEAQLSRLSPSPSLAHVSDKREEVTKKVDFFRNLEETSIPEGGEPPAPVDIT